MLAWYASAGYLSCITSRSTSISTKTIEGDYMGLRILLSISKGQKLSLQNPRVFMGERGTLHDYI